MATTAKSTDQTTDQGAKRAVTNAAREAATTLAGAAGSIAGAADTVAGAAGEVAARLPEAAASTRDTFTEANRLVQSSSDETLKVVGALSVGFAAGLLIGGAPRILVIAALAPAALIGTTVIERMNQPAARGPVQGR